MGKRILLADDSITIQKVIELTFSDEDFEVVTVGNGRLAIEKAQDIKPDIVLCDIIMPEKDGYEVCDFIKKSPLLSNVPVLLLTGAFEPFDQERAARVGCDGFLAKPFEPQTLIAKVKELLTQAASRHSAARPAAAPPAPAPPPVPIPAAMPAAAPAAAAPVPSPWSAPPAPAPAASSWTQPPPPSPWSTPAPAAPPPPVAVPAAPAHAPAEMAGPFDEANAFIPEDAVEAEPGGFGGMELTPEADSLEAAPVDVYDSPVGATADELMEVNEQEAASLVSHPADDSSTVMFRADTVPKWGSQPTMEVPLETRARASKEAAQAQAVIEAHEAGHTVPPPAAPAFEEVFDEPSVEPYTPPSAAAPTPTVAPPAPAPPPAPVAAAAPEPEPELEPIADAFDEPEPMPEALPAAASWQPAAPPEPELTHLPEPEPWTPPPPAWMPAPVATVLPTTVPVRSAPTAPIPAPAPRALSEEASFGVMAAPAPPPPAAAPSAAAGVSVPVDMVETIAQRVIAHISEKVVREIAWEVIPDLAETLIRKEIERLKSELQQS